jgi:hypothetical protein
MVTTQFWSCFLAADQAVTSSTALVDVTGFTFAMEASRTYGFDGHLYFNLGGVVSGVKLGVGLPASPTNTNYMLEVVNGTGLSLVALGMNAGVATALATGGLHVSRVGGIIENGVNAGNLSLQFAQNTSNGSAITAKRGSWFRVWNLS